MEEQPLSSPGRFGEKKLGGKGVRSNRITSSGEKTIKL